MLLLIRVIRDTKIIMLHCLRKELLSVYLKSSVCINVLCFIFYR